MLVLDIQGAELEALKGSKRILGCVRYVYCEVSQVNLYEGGAKVQEIDDYLKGFGFLRVATNWTSHGWGDAFYIRCGEKLRLERAALRLQILFFKVGLVFTKKINLTLMHIGSFTRYSTSAIVSQLGEVVWLRQWYQTIRSQIVNRKKRAWKGH
jgi:hypothetical protein